MKKVVLIPNPNKDVGLSITSMVVKKLSELNITVYLDKAYEKQETHKVIYYTDMPSDADLIIVVGGDGSVIDASQFAVRYSIPLLGVNLGRVGYLTQLNPDNLDLLRRLENKEYKIESKMLLAVEKLSNGKRTECTRLGVNEVVVSHENYLGISDIMLENEHGDQVKYRSDGIIASTPAGSTAYSLSAGGPVVSHTLDSITVTPICPHSFFNRAIVYGPDERIKITNVGTSPLNISVDGRYFDSIASGETCLIYKSSKAFKTLSFGDSNVFTVLSNKINHLNDII